MDCQQWHHNFYSPQPETPLRSADLEMSDTQLTELSHEIFSIEDGNMDIRIIDLDDEFLPVQTSISTTYSFEDMLSRSPKPSSRIISLCSKNSTEPLRITEKCMRKLLKHYEIGPEFLDVLFAFGNKPRESETGIQRFLPKEPDGTAYDVSYLFVYPEKGGSSVKKAWTMRHTGVFHRLDVDGKSLWIILNPMPGSRVQQRLNEAVEGRRSSFDWHCIHLLIISSYIKNWRWYLNDLSDDISKSGNTALTLDFSRAQDYIDGLIALTNLQHLQEKVTPIKSWLRASVEVVTSLNHLRYTSLKNHRFKNQLISPKIEFELFRQELESPLMSVENMMSRSRGTLRLLSVTLNLKNQVTSVNINNNMLSLTKDTVDDSSTVRGITIITLIFLPANLVATIFGMNLFSYQTPTGSGFQVSEKFWLYIVIALPLSLIAFGWWYLAIERPKQKNAEAKLARTQEGNKIERV